MPDETSPSRPPGNQIVITIPDGPAPPSGMHVNHPLHRDAPRINGLLLCLLLVFSWKWFSPSRTDVRLGKTSKELFLWKK
ncbi:hypothetical protein CEXT_747291 [Caerostris extrusa]|uniref:Uncharacterized protein n=1 Tax=Caerostris extrusa TaxID=172846 RepID=A0AAV4MCN2_CAEEX|nr:hypothetical protein CEXT_747291 [Caerostris extrusa]